MQFLRILTSWSLGAIGFPVIGRRETSFPGRFFLTPQLLTIVRMPHHVCLLSVFLLQAASPPPAVTRFRYRFLANFNDNQYRLVDPRARRLLRANPHRRTRVGCPGASARYNRTRPRLGKSANRLERKEVARARFSVIALCVGYKYFSGRKIFGIRVYIHIED